jgi:nucleoside 2-deoxyribosyltransferase
MDRAKLEIEKSDCLLIDMTSKPTGRAFEAGIAFAMGKKIVVIMKRGTQVKETTRRIADLIIEYDQIEDIVVSLSQLK